MMGTFDCFIFTMCIDSVKTFRPSNDEQFKTSKYVTLSNVNVQENIVNGSIYKTHTHTHTHTHTVLILSLIHI